MYYGPRSRFIVNRYSTVDETRPDSRLAPVPRRHLRHIL